MELTAEEFIENFHSLSGTTTGEKRKNLYLLLKTVQHTFGLGFGEVIEASAITPKTPIEEVFKVEVLIYFRKVPELVDVLKFGNPILIDKVLKVSPWFLQKMLENISEQDLVEQLFRRVSYNTKVKLINKLAVCLNNAEKGDAIFEAVQDRYGLYLATKLLPCCTEDLILKCVRSLKFEITPRQLLIIVKKYPKSTESIFEALSQFDDKQSIGDKYSGIFKYLMKRDIVLFFKLYEEYQPSFHLGRRATNKFILSQKQYFIQNSKKFYKFLHKKQTTQSIGKNFAEFYLNMFPSSVGQFVSNVNFYIELLESSPLNTAKLNLLLQIFENNYGNQLWNYPTCVKPKLLELMSVDERETWMQETPKPGSITEIEWICLKKTDISVPMLQKKISLTSNIKERSELIGCLVESCRINEDKRALTSVCKYISAQHHNDSSSVLLCFLETLKDCFGVDTLDDEQWKGVNEIVEQLITRNIMSHHYLEWLYGYINYRLVHQLPVKTQLIDLAKRTNMDFDWYTQIKTLQHQKQVIMLYKEVIPEAFKGTKLNDAYADVINNIVYWNRQHRRDQIPFHLYMDAIKGVKESLKQGSCSFMVDLIEAYRSFMRVIESEKGDWLNLIFKNFIGRITFLEWLIKYDPVSIAQHTATLINPLLDLEYTSLHSYFFKHCRYYSHLDIPQKIIAICLATLSSSTRKKSKIRKMAAVTALSSLMDSAEFIKFAIPYYPLDSPMESDSKKELQKNILQQAIAANLMNVIPSFITLESILHFSKGEYFRFTQRSLNFASLNVAEAELIPFFGALADRPVSVGKHAICQTFRVLSKSEIYKMLNKTMESNKNPSIRKVLLKATLRYFTKNPDDYLWGLVKENTKSVDVSDYEALGLLLDVSKLPRRYLAEYVVFTWGILETLPKPSKKIQKGKFSLLDAVSPAVLPSLPEEFCWYIIEKYFFKFQKLTHSQKQVFSFTSKYIVYSTSELVQEKHLNEVFSLLKSYVKSAWYNNDTRTLGRTFVHYFVKDFCLFFVEKKCSAGSLLIKFIELWDGFLQPHDALEEYLLLQFSLICVDSVTQMLTLQQIGEKLANLCDSVLTVCGTYACTVFGDTLNAFLCHFSNGTTEQLELNRLNLIESIITSSSTSNCFLIAIWLLPLAIPSMFEMKLIYNRIINVLELCTSSMVQLHLSCYMHNLSSDHQVTIPDKSDYLKTFDKRRASESIEEFSSSYRKSNFY